MPSSALPSFGEIKGTGMAYCRPAHLFQSPCKCLSGNGRYCVMVVPRPMRFRFLLLRLNLPRVAPAAHPAAACITSSPRILGFFRSTVGLMRCIIHRTVRCGAFESTERDGDGPKLTGSDLTPLHYKQTESRNQISDSYTFPRCDSPQCLHPAR